MIWPWKKERTAPAEAYDRAALEPVIRSSICTGERTACMRDRETGKIHEIMALRTERDLTEFAKQYGADLSGIRTIY